MSSFEGHDWELYYWTNIKEDGRNHMIGRGEFVRLMFELAGVPFTDHGMLQDGGQRVFQFVRGGGNVDFPIFAPPAIKRGSFVLSQTPSILKYLGKEFGFYPTCAEDEAHADSLMAFVTDFVAEGRLVFHSKCFTQSYYDQIEEVKPTVSWFENERLQKFLSYFENVAAYNAMSHDQGYMIGNTLTYVDIAVFHTVVAAESQFSERFAAIAPQIPLVMAHKERIACIPNIAAYLASERRGMFEGNSMM